MGDLLLAMLHVARPNGDHAPAELSEHSLVLLVALRIAAQFILPKIPPRRWDAALIATSMLMPDAAMDKDHGAGLWHDNVRASRQICPVKTEAVAHAVQNRANLLFSLGILASDAAHVPRAMFGGMSVGHERG